MARRAEVPQAVNGRAPDPDACTGLIFDIDTFAVHDGPGIRMAVYCKGCPLDCKWCHSPESRRPTPEMVFFRDRCACCGTCEQVCPQSTHRVDGSEHVIYRNLCMLCRRCVEHCANGALAIKGYRIGADEVIARAARLKPFFDHSSGGITLTGGEVTMQPEFAAAVLAGCRSLGIHTAIETCGACSWDRLEQLLAHTDLVLYDLKLIDDRAHRRWTGASNRPILRNAARLAKADAPRVQVRVPLIPEITDTEENLRGIFAFMRDVGLSSVALLPYNPSASAKYEWLGLPYEIQGEPQSPERLASFVATAQQMGIEATIGS
jgi:pyruvate formate lyase activating enzyme